MKKHNFYAGPCILSQYTIKNTADAIINFADMGLSILEISHRSKQFQAVVDEAVALVKELLEIPEGYSVLFLGGGASLQFAMAPMNFLNKKAAYLDTGVWANKSIKEAKLFGEVDVVASSKDKNYNYIPKGFEAKVPTDVDYFYYCSNNTIYGTEIRRDPEVPVRMIADMSSDIFSRPVDVSKYDLIFAGAQKNLAPAGVTIVIVKDDALGHVDRILPTMLNYKTHVDKGSMFNTPPVLPIFSALQTLKYYKSLGGLKEIEKMDIAKADKLYDAIDNSKLFEATIPNKEDRSIMNVCFVMKPEYKDLEQEFFDFATSKGMVGIKGHRSVGGFRASLYNALPMESVEALVACMKEFEAMH
ncbi:MAG: 3-phosphoserine/phosphohydroxythreonine transaminase [Clostridium sp.]|nr:3-phosphoserine/phosphohydroxythreonine transaminase [Prevotella sp.]MCM1429647.1 3-phosphoserine/phosphohydroxythreonine transaminase [Clostridium sp.]MCM1474649.1 3-phosphoserine/phosphohydroxythreonine transaminase [Muribaculaceae bacterium]